MKLFYKTTSNTWLDGLPIGEGRLAAMVVNDKENDRFFLNHEWLWRGTKEARDRHADKTADKLEFVRELLAKGSTVRVPSAPTTSLAVVGRRQASSIPRTMRGAPRILQDWTTISLQVL